MNMRTCAVLVLLAAPLWGGARTYEGLAYDLETNELVYAERHRELVSADGSRLETAYADPEGEVFARREVRFGQRPLAPEFELVDQRSDYVEGAEWQGDSTRVYKSDDGEQDEALVSQGRHPLVIDAGFDALVVDNWDALQAGERIRFDFLNADRLDRIPFRLQMTGRRDTADGPVTDFEMTLANPMLRWLVDAIKITYLDADRQLYEYVGVSNIKDPEGRNYTVRIEFPRTSETRDTGSLAATPVEIGSGADQLTSSEEKQ